MDTLIIHGCGGHARSVASNIKNEWHNLVFIDAAAKPGEKILGYSVYPNLDFVDHPEFCAHHVALGNLEKKSELFLNLQKRKYELPSLVSRNAVVMPEAKIGAGTFIGAGAYVGPNAVIGENSIINTHAVIEHDTRIGDHTHVSIQGAVAGYTEVGNWVLLGAGSCVVDKIKILHHVVVGAGAVVCSDILKSGIYVGVPARRVK